MNKALLRSKLKAMGVHLLCSLLVALSVGYVVFFWWYPYPFGFASGGLQLFLLVTGVDLVLGPMLTLVAFDPHKRKVLMVGDFIVIGVLQLCALVYGVHAVSDSRPVAVVFEMSRFRAIRAGDLSAEELKKATSGLGELSWTGPKLIGTRVLTHKEEQDALFIALEGRDIGMRPEFWSPYEKEQARIKDIAKKVDLLIERYPDAKPELEQIAAKAGAKLQNLGFFPVLSKQGIFTLLINKENGAFVGYILLDGSL